MSEEKTGGDFRLEATIKPDRNSEETEVRWYKWDREEGRVPIGVGDSHGDQTRSYPRLEAILSSGTSKAASESGLLKSGAVGNAWAARS